MAFSIAQDISIGILALQGAFIEHEASIQRLNRKIRVIQVRTPEDLEKCDALIIPGGEPLKSFIKSKPVWGTCAGAILLSQSVVGAKKGGQELLGGMSVKIARNGWGSQVESFEAPLDTEGLNDSAKPFNGIFIRAPVILSLTNTKDDPSIQVVARLPLDQVPQSLIDQAGEANKEDTTIVAVRQGLHFLTTFHPELTKDDRFHEYFVRECVLGRTA
ncbi:Senecionine N-oxygenase [Paramarasmius palmivorus]|uniref:Senecionine N-oxygenase n=1 Tax=Paramarasmius palmivorus TaxID=297713 RepID=A0AAW0DG48_9AGAR